MATTHLRSLGRKTVMPQSVGGTAPHAGTSRRVSAGAGHSHPMAGDERMRQLRELSLDLVQLAFDLAGFVDPTPISDGASALISLGRGQWFDAVISGVSMVPYVGDLAKAGKLPKYAKALEKAVKLASHSKDCAKALMPTMRKLENLLDLIPKGKNKHIDRMRTSVREFLGSNAPAKAKKIKLPDISKRYEFSEWTSGDRLYQQASGKLGVPGKVKTHRSKSAQSKVSRGTGDHAGHLIGDRFGAPGDARNLTQQNFKSNQGSYKRLEDEWAKKLEQGTGVEVTVTDVTRRGEDRPFMRRVEWAEITPDGKRSTHQLDFTNTHTPQSRTAQGIKPTVSTPQTDNVVNVDFVKKKVVK